MKGGVPLQEYSWIWHISGVQTLNGSYNSDWHFTATGDIILFIVTG